MYVFHGARILWIAEQVVALSLDERFVLFAGTTPLHSPDLVDHSGVVGDEMKLVVDDPSMGDLLLYHGFVCSSAINPYCVNGYFLFLC